MKWVHDFRGLFLKLQEGKISVFRFSFSSLPHRRLRLAPDNGCWLVMSRKGIFASVSLGLESNREWIYLICSVALVDPY